MESASNTDYEAHVDQTFEKLINEIKKYRPNTSLEMVYDAFKLARHAHQGQKRNSGEPYIMHPLEVAIILAEIKTDMESISAGLLHDVVEDTPFTHEDLVDQFGDEVATLVDGVTKIKKVAYVTKTDEQAENYRKMFFHMSRDVRILLIKIADRLHNMRTLAVKREEKQREIAQETLDIYAPLAHRLGIAKLRYELEDLGFKYTDREFYNNLADKIKIKQSARQELIEQMILEISTRLKNDNIPARVDGRPKRFYSIYKKMKAKGKTLDELYDLFAIRVLVNEVSECYEVLGRLHEMYTPVPGRFKDYIGMKKTNGYQSLHTTLVGPGEPFEVQIRTYDMHSVAEFGIAAHWKYKEGGKEAKDKWLQSIMEAQLGITDSGEYIDALRTDLSAFEGQVYCFTPQGEVIPLARGSCVIDFAYAIHSAVGNKMIGAKVDGKMVPVNYILETGQRVEVLTSSSQSKGPNRDWLNIVKTSTARSKITQWFNRESRDVNHRKGRELLEEAAKELGVTLDILLADGREADILSRFNTKNLDQLYVMVGVGGLKEKLVANHLFREYEKVQPPPSDEELIQAVIDASGKPESRKKTSGIVVKGIGDTAVRFGKCCGPLPGDRIVGFVTRGRGLTIHRADCVNVRYMDELEKRRIIEAEWQVPEKSEHTYHTELRITCDDRDGILADITRILSEEKVRITSLTARSLNAEAIFLVGMELSSGEHFERIQNHFKRSLGVHEVTRMHG